MFHLRELASKRLRAPASGKPGPAWERAPASMDDAAAVAEAAPAWAVRRAVGPGCGPGI